MSGLHFTAEISVADDQIGQNFWQDIANILSQQSDESKRQLIASLHQSYPDSSIIDLQSLVHLNIEQTDSGEIQIRSEYPDLDISFFESLIELLNSLGLEQYKATLFDSASGGSMHWQMPDELEEEDFDFEDKLVCLLGVEDDIAEALEDNGAIVKTEFDPNAKLVVYSDEEDVVEYLEQPNLKIKIISEEDFWDEYGFLFG